MISGMVKRSDALKHFKTADPKFYKATLPHHASLPEILSKKRTHAHLFESLASIVISQQLGTAAADTICRRVKEVCGGRITPEAVLRLSDAAFRKAGLSGAKTKTLRAIATAVESGELDLLSLRNLTEAEAAERLMRIWGLGPWSVEMFLMFALGRADVFSPGDLGLLRAIEALYGVPKGAPREKYLKIAARWAPHRTYACLLLWRTRDITPQVVNRGARPRGTKAG